MTHQKYLSWVLNIDQVLVQDQRCWLKNKLDLWLGPWSLTLSCNIDLELLGLCNSEPLKQWRSSHSEMFFKIVSLKILQYPQEIPVLESFEGLKTCSLIKKRPQHRCFPVNIAKCLRIAFLKSNSGGCF